MSEGEVPIHKAISKEIVSYLEFDWTSDGLELVWVSEGTRKIKLGYIPWNIVATYIKEYL